MLDPGEPRSSGRGDGPLAVPASYPSPPAVLRRHASGVGHAPTGGASPSALPNQPRRRPRTGVGGASSRRSPAGLHPLPAGSRRRPGQPLPHRSPPCRPGGRRGPGLAQTAPQASGPGVGDPALRARARRARSPFRDVPRASGARPQRRAHRGNPRTRWPLRGRSTACLRRLAGAPTRRRGSRHLRRRGSLGTDPPTRRSPKPASQPTNGKELRRAGAPGARRVVRSPRPSARGHPQRDHRRP